MKIFVISLKSANDRRKAIAQQMKKLGLEFDFFDAIDGRKGLPKQYESMIDRKLAKQRYGRMSDGEFAVALTHSLLYEKIVKEKISDAIILEDDCIIGSDFCHMVKNKLCEKSGKDFIFLYHLHTPKLPFGETKFMKKYNMINIAKQAKGTVGYYLTLDVAKHIHKNIFPISYVADWGVNIMNFNVGAIYPRIVGHPPLSNSYLEKQRNTKTNRFGQFGVLNWFFYQLKKPFITKICNRVDGD